MSRAPDAQRALVVEADPETARNLSLVLSQWGYETKWATSSWQALEIVNHWRPHVALVDAGLPVTDGWQLTKIVRGRYSADEIKLIILAARKTVAPPAHERVYDGLLLKPVVIAKLREAMESCATANLAHDPL